MLKARNITQEEKQFLLDLPDDTISNVTLVKMFNHYYDKQTKQHHDPMFHPYDRLHVVKGDLKCIHEEMDTTVGLFLFNKYLIDGCGLAPHISYLNKSMNGKDLDKLGDRVGQLYMKDLIDNDTISRWITVRDTFLSMVYQIILPSLSENIMKVQPAIVKKMDELLEKYKTEIDAGDLVTMNKVQSELVNYARDLLQDDESMILYMSGSKPEFSNNYKVLSIMRGPMKNEVTGKYEFVTSNLVGGIKKEDIPVSANTILAGEYSTAISTATYGYQSKRILYFMQGETVGEKGSDCGSKATMKMAATKRLADEYRYFVEGGKLMQLTPENISKYEGRMLRFRTPMACKRDNGPCNICCGDYPYLLGIQNIGLMATKITSILLNASTKRKHNLQFKTTSIKIMD